MNKLLVQLVLVISSVIVISGCNSGGSLPAEEEVDVFFGPLPAGLPVYVEIVEPYFDTSESDDSEIALFSYKPQDSAADSSTQNQIFSSDSNIFVSLNTLDDSNNPGQTEYTALVKNDSVYLVNHLNNEIRLLSHFTTKVCELIPSEKPEESLESLGPDSSGRVLTVLHDKLIYVMTVETSTSASGASPSCTSGGKKRFYALPLDHQLDASVDEDGQIDALELVTEAQARSKLIFGWVPDPDNAAKEILDYAYLGYGGAEQKLKLFDKSGELVWSQHRVIESFTFDIDSSAPSVEYFFHVEALENYQYLVQLGLDVFVVDAGRDLISKPFNQIEYILSDRVLALSAKDVIANTADWDYLTRSQFAAKTVYDDDNLFIIDDSKIYQLLYQQGAPARNPTITTRVVKQDPLNIDGKEHLVRKQFSQFDLKSCASSDNYQTCFAAHDVEAQAWQFFTPCEDEFGCDSTTEVLDNCETLTEKQQTQSNEPLCSASYWWHISELNNPANDAALIAYMQYEDYIQDTDFTLNNGLLYVKAKMDQKDILLSYDFNQDFIAPKSLREHVLFGKRASLVGMDPYFVNNNLFLTALQGQALRSYECYKNYQKVTCLLHKFDDVEFKGACTGKDLSEGKCTAQFREYESKAFYCNESKLENLTCSDTSLDQLNSLAIEMEDEDAKWLKLYDYESDSDLIYLLIGEHDLARDNNQLDEGKIYLPALYKFDMTTGQKVEEAVAFFESGSIEQVVGGWLYKTPTMVASEVFGRINVISDEVVQHQGTKPINESALVTYLLEQSFEDEAAVIPEFIKAPKVAERLFERPATYTN